MKESQNKRSRSCYDGKTVQKQLQNDPLYKMISRLAFWLDKRYLDPLIGFLLPMVGDFATFVLNLPFLYFALFRVKSVPLTLAILFNALWDVVLGLIPFGIGDIIDIFHRSYVKNCRLIKGYVEEDAHMMREVRKKTVYFVLAIVFLLLGIGLLVNLGFYLFQHVYDLILGGWS